MITMIRYRIACACLAALALTCTGCVKPAATARMTTGADGSRVILDFEQPDPDVEWRSAAAATAPAAPPGGSSVLSRSSLRPASGLWSLKATLHPDEAGAIAYTFRPIINLTDYDTLSAAVVHCGAAASNGQFSAAMVLTDLDGGTFTGDPYPVISQWQTIPLDLRAAAERGVDLAHIADVRVELRPIGGGKAPRSAAPSADGQTLDIQTDSWLVQHQRRTYIDREAAPGHFTVEQIGPRLRVGLTNQSELIFHNRASGSDVQRPWLEIWQGSPRRLVLGQPSTGLMLLDTSAVDALGPVHQEAASQPASSAAHLPAAGWPTGAGQTSRWTWTVGWTSPVAAMVEVKQECGPYDRLGQPGVTVGWRFMIYQSGQVFVHAQWSRSSGSTIAGPITWALALDRATLGPANAGMEAPTPADAQRLLTQVYPSSVRDSIATALPHLMQPGAPVAFLGKTAVPTSNAWWWTAGASGSDERVVFGSALQNPATTAPEGKVDGMLVVNSGALMQAACFGQYLVPPGLTLKEGELDRNFPGDSDNDGFVEPYGFQVIRLAGGRAGFTINPQGRPLFYPAYLLTIPAVEREAVNLNNSRLMVNIDGKQFADPPQFPDGSFLVQVPYVIDAPVTVEAILEPK